ncbi:endonuclease domain-containing protein [Novosphingobium sp. 9U]|uniref:endonuclease domain-containing protein n=1 Tax=Novosphingobium sp. 9U TaxID=2653158 RepID=UPI0012F436D6|nr:DUF559 domain-containing protein [Novosphingobium sp. 9U]VWX51318.1 conserved hypothetical protein [Novosphingobium sp. 9U]
MRDHTDKALIAAKRLRTALSLPEVLLWRLLKESPLGLKFRRQHPIGDFVADFYCHQALTIIEIDGRSHDMGDRPARDKRRDAWLVERGLKVVRIPATEVLRDPQSVAQSVSILCSAAPPPSALRAATSPEGGGSMDIS